MTASPKLTQRLIDDADRDVIGWLTNRVGDRFGRLEGTAFWNGNGTSQPRGFMSYPTDTNGDDTRAWGTLEHVVSGNASLITADALFALQDALRAPYRQGASWLMASDTKRQIRILKDGNGQYLLREGLIDGAPDQLLGHPVVLDENMASVAVDAFPIIFANWMRFYIVVDHKRGTQVLRDPFTDKPHVLLYTTAGRSTLTISLNTRSLVGDKLTTPLEITRSAQPSGIGSDSM